MTELYALLWSRQGNGFHIEPLARACENGLNFFQQDKANDYLVIFTGTTDQCSDKAEELRPICRERGTVRDLYRPEPD